MQVAEQEIIFPLKTSRRFRLVIMACSLLFVLAVEAWLLVQSARLGFDRFSWFLLILGAVLILLDGGVLVWGLGQQRTSAPLLRVTPEGIFASVFIPWRDITAIFPYSPPGAGLVVGIVVRDFDALLARYIQEQAPGVLMRGLLRINAWLLPRFPGYQAQVHIPQRMLPLSIHEVLAQIHTRFAAELHEHQITLREWPF